MSCVFCHIVNKKIDTPLHYEDDELIAFDDIHPKAPIHVLIIPKKHIANLNDIDKNDILLMGKMMEIAKKLAKDFNIAQAGYRLIMNCNQEGGQEIYHIHLHLLGGHRLNN